MSDKFHSVVGIDLGTTFSALATYNKLKGESEILVNRAEENSTTVPSVVGLHPTLRKAIVGRVAKRNLANDPQNTVIEIKREMGEEFTSETLDKFNARQANKKLDDPVEVFFAGDWYRPQEISALILMKMKEIAETEIGEEIRDAVVTVPAYFTAKQKKATEEAALLAGLYPRQLIPEPTAAAICYGVDKMEEERKIYLVYDLGGGTFDVSIIEVEETNINVIATSGDPRLGGGDFDDRITRWTIDQLQKQYNLDVSNNANARARIKYEAELAKVRLSTHMKTSLNLAEIFPTQSPVLELTRETFEREIEDLLKKAITYVDVAINIASEKKGIQRNQIDAILLVGGSSKIPKVKEMLLDYFGRDEAFVKSDLNPDEVVARGAAIMASRFQPSPAPFDIAREIDNSITRAGAEDVNVQLITEHSLGVGIQDNLFSKIIDQGSNIPIEMTQSDYTNPGPVDHVEVRVYQGEGKYIYDNTLIGTLTIGPMEPQPAGFHRFDATFKLDQNGLLSVMIHHANMNKTYQAKFEHKTGVGGKDALGALRSKLLRLYADKTAAPPQPVIPPPPIPSAGPYVPSPPPVPTPTPTPASQAPEVRPEAVAVPTATPVQPPIPGVIDATVEVPPEFKAIVRRARKRLLEGPHPALLAAFNAFSSALNQGASEGDLQELGDTLDDVFHKPFEMPAILEPTVEVPAQFKSIVRRANKQLLESLDPELLTAFNAFTRALNTGAAETDLEELGDQLENIYHNVRNRQN